MISYISLLRGINVSGQKLIKMDFLRSCYERLGFSKVSSYLQSGNVVFTSKETDLRKLEQKICKGIKQEFGFDVQVLVLGTEALKQIIIGNPLVAEAANNPSGVYVSFLLSSPAVVNLKKIEDKKQEGEVVAVGENVVYLYCPGGYGRSKLNNNYLEATLKVGATTRNWKTTNELLIMAEQL